MDRHQIFNVIREWQGIAPDTQLIETDRLTDLTGMEAADPKAILELKELKYLLETASGKQIPEESFGHFKTIGDIIDFFKDTCSEMITSIIHIGRADQL